MTTTAGSLALAGSVAAARRLRRRAAARGRRGHPRQDQPERVGQLPLAPAPPAAGAARGGQSRNPYALDRTPCGSSSGSGVAVAANLARGRRSAPRPTARSSARRRPTRSSASSRRSGLVSRAGIIPISHSQDTAGPDGPHRAPTRPSLLGALAGVDPRDPATAASRGHGATPTTRASSTPTACAARASASPARGSSATASRPTGSSRRRSRAMKAARRRDRRSRRHPARPGEYDDAELEVLLYEFKADLNAYLADARARGARCKSLRTIIAFNEREPRTARCRTSARSCSCSAQAKGPLTDPAYRDALAQQPPALARGGHRRGDATSTSSTRWSRRPAAPAWPIDLVNGDHYLGGSSTPAAVAGYPRVTVPGGLRASACRSASRSSARAWSEPTLHRAGLRLRAGDAPAPAARRGSCPPWRSRSTRPGTRRPAQPNFLSSADGP